MAHADRMVTLVSLDNHDRGRMKQLRGNRLKEGQKIKIMRIINSAEIRVSVLPSGQYDSPGAATMAAETSDAKYRQDEVLIVDKVMEQ